MVCAAPVDSLDQSFIQFGVPGDHVVYQDQSALTQEQNLKSKEYQDFIHQLYRLDKDNLRRADDLFVAAGASDDDPTASRFDAAYDSSEQGVAPEIASPEYYGIYTPRQKRGLFFRPLSVYRERQAETQHEQALRSKRFRHSMNANKHLDDDDDDDDADDDVKYYRRRSWNALQSHFECIQIKIVLSISLFLRLI